MNYKEFPQIEIPTFLQDWEDVSWHNDATASSVLDLDFGMFPYSLRVWVNSDIVEEREMFADFKYMIVLEVSEDGDVVLSQSANTEDEARHIIETMKTLVKEGKVQ